MNDPTLFFIVIGLIMAGFLLGFWSGLRRGKNLRDDAWMKAAFDDKIIKVGEAYFTVLPVHRDIIKRYRVGSRQIKD